MNMNWDKLKVFHAAAEAGSFTHAGEQLGLSQSAVSRQVSALEQELGVSLFHRHARGLILTEQGELLHHTAHDVFMQLEAARAKLTDSRERPNGDLRVTTTPGIGVHWLTPRLGEFVELYPDIHLTLITTDEELDLAMRAADVAIRLRQPTQPDLIQRKGSRCTFMPMHRRNTLSASALHARWMISTTIGFYCSGEPRCQITLKIGAGSLKWGAMGRDRARARSQSTRCLAFCALASAASGLRCCPTTWSKRTAASCSYSVNQTRSRSTRISSIRKSSRPSRASRYSVISL